MSQAVRLWVRAPHVSAAILALGISAFILWVLFDVAHLDRRLVRWAAPQVLDVKDLSPSLQGEAFADPHMLPIYGSSEFRNDTPYAGRVFFSHFPTGFELFPIGKAGAKPLIVAERIAALGNKVRGKKLVIILSPTWFLAKTENAPPYAANFSALQASDLAFESPISRSLKKGLAKEMLRYPDTLEGHALLRLELERLANSKQTPEGHLIEEIGRTGNTFLDLLDRGRSLFALSANVLQDPADTTDRPHPARQKPNWDRLLKEATEFSDRTSYAAARKNPTNHLRKGDEHLEEEFSGSHQISLTDRLNRTDEWYHLKLLLRTLHELGAKPLILSIPINATSFGNLGVTAEQRAQYHTRLRQEVGDYGYPLASFEKEETNPSFFGDSMGHPSALGWMTFNRMINRFYHDKLPDHLD